jgi:hypothetical protein
MKTGGVNPHIQFPELQIKEHQTDLLKRLGCPPGHMPYQMQPLNVDWGVQFMWNTFNPFQPKGKWVPPNPIPPDGRAGAHPYPENAGAHPCPVTPWSGGLPAMFDACVGHPKWVVLVKLFGWIERMGQLALGNFNPETHVVRGEQREQLDALVRKGEATVYMSSDPETSKSHAALWGAALRDGVFYIFDESPRWQEGEWVDGNGDKGEGQRVYAGTGANWYKRYFREREREWGITDGEWAAPDELLQRLVERRGDPRGFASKESTATGTRSMFELYAEDHGGEDAMLAPMTFVPAQVKRSSHLDLDIIINLLAYDVDKAQREGGFTVENRPRLLISDRCQNLIRCAMNYSLTDKQKMDEDSPYRDFIDSLRYLLSMPAVFHDPAVPAAVGGRGW